MDAFSAYVPRLIPKHEPFVSGRRSCKGCGKALSARIASKIIFGSLFPSYTRQLPLPPNQYGYAYDQLSSDIIIEQYLANAEEINSLCAKKSRSKHKVIKKAVIGINRQIFFEDYLAHTRIFQGDKRAFYLCFDNEPYINTLIDATSPQPFILNEEPHAVSDTDIKNIIHEKNIPLGISEEDFSYMATACPGYPFDFIKKIQAGIEHPGNAFILVLTPCPTGWIFPPRFTHKVGLSAVQTGYFPLYEKNNGKLRITEHLSQRKPLQQYIAMQKRFFTFPPQLIVSLQHAVDIFYEELIKKALSG